MMDTKPRPPQRDEPPPAGNRPTNSRRLRRNLDRDMALAVIIMLVGVGGALIAAIYGVGPAMLGLVCLLGGAGLFGLLWMVLTLIERWAGD